MLVSGLRVDNEGGIGIGIGGGGRGCDESDCRRVFGLCGGCGSDSSPLSSFPSI
jgi:hypothetical protein